MGGTERGRCRVEWMHHTPLLRGMTVCSSNSQVVTPRNIMSRGCLAIKFHIKKMATKKNLPYFFPWMDCSDSTKKIMVPHTMCLTCRSCVCTKSLYVVCSCINICPSVYLFFHTFVCSYTLLYVIRASDPHNSTSGSLLRRM